MKKTWRKTEQYLLPEVKPFNIKGSYDIYPTFKLDDNKIASGFDSLVEIISSQKKVIIDGYIGVFYDDFREKLEEKLKSLGRKTSWKSIGDFLKHPDVISELVSPFTGGDDPIFGYRTSLILEDFFDLHALKETKCDNDADINILIGPGASLAGWNGLLVYIDLPKSEIQFRSRAGSITNLGYSSPSDPKKMFKCFYFVDWLVLNKHKQDILPDIDIIIDSQNPLIPGWM